jgi:hypothetical protein
MPDIDDRARKYKRRWKQKASGSRPVDGYLKEGEFRSRVFKNREARDRWARGFAEAGRRNYEHFVQKRPQAYLKMMEKGAAFEVGVKEAFFRGWSARRRLKKMGIKGPKHAKDVAQKLFREAMQFSDPKKMRRFDKLVRTAGW